MVRSARILLLLISALAAGAAFGQRRQDGPQNNDLSVMAGPVIGSTLAVAGSSAAVDVSGDFSFQANFAHTIHSYSFADLWWEFPTTFVSRESTNVGGGVKSVSFSASFGTPGVRLHVPVGSRVSFYGAAGGGYGLFESDEVGVTGARISTHSNYHGVLDFGGGMDFRLTRRLSARGEVRDFVTGKGLGGASGRNQVVFGFGMAVHF